MGHQICTKTKTNCSCLYLHFRCNLLTFFFIFATVHSLMNCTNLNDRWPAHLPMQYASNIKLHLALWLIASHIRVACAKEVRQRATIRNRYNQAPHLTQDTNGKVTHLTQDTNGKVTTSQRNPWNQPFPAAGDHLASINRGTRKHNKNKTEIT